MSEDPIGRDRPDREPTLSDDPDRRAAGVTLSRADERVRHSDPAVRARLRRRRRRTNRIYLGIGLCVLLVLVGYVVLYFAPVLAVRRVEVSGLRTIGPEIVQKRAGVATGTPLLQVDTHAVARRVAGVPQVDEVTVRRDYPSTLTIEVVERIAVVTVEVDGAMHLVDDGGIDFGEGEAPQGTPVLTLGPSARDRMPQIVRELSTILREVRDTAGQQVTAIEVDTPADIVLTLADGRRVEWGTAGRDHEKAVALHLVLQQPGQTWNVSNPALPAAR